MNLKYFALVQKFLFIKRIIPTRFAIVFAKLYSYERTLSFIRKIECIDISPEDLISFNTVSSIIIALFSFVLFYFGLNLNFIVSLLLGLSIFLLCFHELNMYPRNKEDELRKTLNLYGQLALQDYLSVLLTTKSVYFGLQTLAKSNYPKISNNAKKNLYDLVLNNIDTQSLSKISVFKYLSIPNDFMYESYPFEIIPNINEEQNISIELSSRISVAFSIFLFSFLFSIIFFSLFGLAMTYFIFLLIPLHYLTSKVLEKKLFY